MHLTVYSKLEFFDTIINIFIQVVQSFMTWWQGILLAFPMKQISALQTTKWEQLKHYKQQNDSNSSTTNNKMTANSATLSPCQGRLVLVKYINTYPNDSISSRRLVKEGKYKKILVNLNYNKALLKCIFQQIKIDFLKKAETFRYQPITTFHAKNQTLTLATTSEVISDKVQSLCVTIEVILPIKSIAMPPSYFRDSFSLLSRLGEGHEWLFIKHISRVASNKNWMI